MMFADRLYLKTILLLIATVLALMTPQVVWGEEVYCFTDENGIEYWVDETLADDPSCDPSGTSYSPSSPPDYSCQLPSCIPPEIAFADNDKSQFTNNDPCDSNGLYVCDVNGDCDDAYYDCLTDLGNGDYCTTGMCPGDDSVDESWRWQSGYDHGCSDARVGGGEHPYLDKHPTHTEIFMDAYNDGFHIGSTIGCNGEGPPSWNK